MKESFLSRITNEKSDVWIQIYKAVVVVGAALILLGTLVVAVETSYSIGEFLGTCVAGVFVAAVVLTTGMLSINFLSNVQIIREKMETLEILNNQAKGE